MVSNYEPGEDWISDYDKQRLINGAELLPPHSHPAAPAPGAGKFTDRESRLH